MENLDLSVVDIKNTSAKADTVLPSNDKTRVSTLVDLNLHNIEINPDPSFFIFFFFNVEQDCIPHFIFHIEGA